MFHRIGASIGKSFSDIDRSVENRIEILKSTSQSQSIRNISSGIYKSVIETFSLDEAKNDYQSQKNDGAKKPEAFILSGFGYLFDVLDKGIGKGILGNSSQILYETTKFIPNTLSVLTGSKTESSNFNYMEILPTQSSDNIKFKHSRWEQFVSGVNQIWGGVILNRTNKTGITYPFYNTLKQVSEVGITKAFSDLLNISQSSVNLHSSLIKSSLMVTNGFKDTIFGLTGFMGNVFTSYIPKKIRDRRDNITAENQTQVQDPRPQQRREEIDTSPFF